MKNRYLKIQILTIAVLLLGTLSVSGVKDSDELCIKLNFKQGPWDTTGKGTNDGRWQTNGAFVDGGTVTDNYQMHWPGMSSSYEMIGRNGVLYIDVELEYNFDLDKKWKGTFEGTWTVVGGTGDYEGATGEGEATQIIVFGSAMHSAHMIPGTGGPATSNHVLLEGTIQVPS